MTIKRALKNPDCPNVQIDWSPHLQANADDADQCRFRRLLSQAQEMSAGATVHRFPKWRREETYTIAHDARTSGKYIVILVSGDRPRDRGRCNHRTRPQARSKS